MNTTGITASPTTLSPATTRLTTIASFVTDHHKAYDSRPHNITPGSIVSDFGILWVFEIGTSFGNLASHQFCIVIANICIDRV